MAKGISIHIGLNGINLTDYSSALDILKGAEKDAIAMKQILKNNGFSSQRLSMDQAKRNIIITEIINASQQLNSGDIFCLTFSGHGGRVPKNMYNSESVGYFETWCLYDGLFFDAELTKLLSLFKLGVRILIISDSCHSGGILDKTTEKFKRPFAVKSIKSQISINTFNMRSVFYKNIISQSLNHGIPKCSIKLLAACKADETTKDGFPNSEFTAKLIKVWDNGSFSGKYEEFCSSISMQPPPKEAIIQNSGMNCENCNFDKPFKI